MACRAKLSPPTRHAFFQYIAKVSFITANAASCSLMFFITFSTFFVFLTSKWLTAYYRRGARNTSSTTSGFIIPAICNNVVNFSARPMSRRKLRKLFSYVLRPRAEAVNNRTRFFFLSTITGFESNVFQTRRNVIRAINSILSTRERKYLPENWTLPGDCECWIVNYLWRCRRVKRVEYYFTFTLVVIWCSYWKAVCECISGMIDVVQSFLFSLRLPKSLTPAVA